ncbi:hypothetical protein [Brachybacterium sp. UMB0905]|uniref:hypothetical protein n=1 Tax=Brachybacterium sp. UMB0905 TaxID=2069310 RepID=UPI0013040995|nr:hypothetical protein [Brachybacterium sp. UMB0905]
MSNHFTTPDAGTAGLTLPRWLGMTLRLIGSLLALVAGLLFAPGGAPPSPS